MRQSKRRWGWVGFVVAVAWGGNAQPVPAQAPPAPVDEAAAPSPVTLAPDLHYVGVDGLSAFLFTSEEGHVLIDGPLDEDVPETLAQIRALGFDPADIRVHLVTHAHFDHVGGVARLMDASGGALFVSEADAPFVAAGRDFGIETDGYRAPVVGRTLADGETVRVGPIELTALLTPGHTPGCTSWTGSIEIAGRSRDFVLVCSLSVLGSYRLVGADATYPGQAGDFCRSAEVLAARRPDVFLSNHAGFFDLEGKAEALAGGDTEAFVDPEGYAAFMERARSAIDRALERQGVAGGCDGL